jgi:hypothetical protein
MGDVQCAIGFSGIGAVYDGDRKYAELVNNFIYQIV